MADEPVPSSLACPVEFLTLFLVETGEALRSNFLACYFDRALLLEVEVFHLSLGEGDSSARHIIAPRISRFTL